MGAAARACGKNAACRGPRCHPIGPLLAMTSNMYCAPPRSAHAHQFCLPARAGRSAAEACRPRADEVVAASSSVCAWVGICMSGHIDENVDRPLHDF